MTKDDEPVRRRKPLRRTAWSLLIGGLVLIVLMIGTGLLLLAGGEDIGERASVHKHPGPQAAGAPRCELIGSDGEPEYRWLDWADSARSSGDVTVRCAQDAIFLTGSASWIASALQGPLIVAPVGLALLGILLFFPRFTLSWARLTNRSLVRRWLDRRR
jgi:hypothetical protein